MLEPENNPNPTLMVDPPRLLRWIFSKRVLGREADPDVLQTRRRGDRRIPGEMFRGADCATVEEETWD